MAGGSPTGAREAPDPARPLQPDDAHLPDHIRVLLLRAQTQWLKNTDVLTILQQCDSAALIVSSEPPVRPQGGTIFLFDRKAVRFFRKDGHNWRKKADGKTVRETHEKLKVGNVEMLNCYYAHSENVDGPQRRCYWQLDSENDIVLVHYLVVNRTRTGSTEQLMILPLDPSTAPQPLLDELKDEEGVEAAELDMRGPMSPAPQDYMLPSISIDSFLAGIEETNSMHHGKGEQADALDRILPSWEELAPYSGLNADALHSSEIPTMLYCGTTKEQKRSTPYHVNWLMADRQGLDSGLSSHVVHAGGSLRMIEPIDHSLYGAMPQEADDMGLNVLGTRQIPHDARQNMRRGAPVGRGNIRAHLEDSLYSSKHDQLQRAAEAMQNASAVLQGVAGSIRSTHSSTGPELAAALPAHQDEPLLVESASYPPAVQHAALQFSNEPPNLHSPPAYRDRRQLASAGPPFPIIPEQHSMHSSQTTIRASPFGAQTHHHAPIQREAPPVPAVDPHPFAAERSRVLDSAELGRRRRQLGTRSISMELPTAMRTHSRGVTWQDAGGGEVDDIGGSKARGGAYAASQALALEAEVSSLIQHLQQPGSGLPPEMIDGKVRSLDEHLIKLESASAQLSRHRSGPMPSIKDDMAETGMAMPDVQDNNSSSMPCGTDTDAMTDVASRPHPFEILDYAPNWDFTTGGAKLILSCNFQEQAGLDVSNEFVHVMFDREEVTVNVLRPGVLMVFVPPHDVGTIDLRLTFGDGIPRSATLPFTYRIAPQLNRGQESSLIQGSDREMQLRLINMLTGVPSQRSSDQDSGGCSSEPSRTNHQHGGQTVKHEVVKYEDDAASDLAASTVDQKERLLRVLLERKVQAFVSQVKSEEPQKGRLKFCKALSSLNPSGHAPVHMLAGLGYERALDLLLTADANPSLKDAWGHTPLHWAAARGRCEAVALLVVRQADLQATTYLSETAARLTAADAAAQSGFDGMAAFLAEQQLRQSVCTLAGTAGAGGVSLQRKRSRHLPDEETGQDAPLIDVTTSDARSTSISNLVRLEQGPASGKENLLESAGVIARAKKDAETLENAMLRKYVRQKARQEKTLRLARMQAAALKRLSQRFDWRGLESFARAQPASQQERMLAWIYNVGSRIQALQLGLKSAITMQASERKPPPVTEEPSPDIPDYGSDSDIAMSRSESFSSHRKLQHIHNSRRAGARSSLTRIASQDIRSILRAGIAGGEGEPAASQGQRNATKSAFSRAVAHVESLRHQGAQQQYLELKRLQQALRVLLQAGTTFKFARTTDRPLSC